MYCRRSTCLPVVQVTGPRSDFVCQRAVGNDATEGVCFCAGHDTTRSKTDSQSSQPGFSNKGEYIIEVKRFLKVFKRKWPEIAASLWLFHWGNAPVHTANNATKFLAKNNIRTLQHPPYSPDLAPADYFLFPETEEWPGWCVCHPRDLQDGAGTGATKYRRKGVCRSLPEVATSSWKVHSPPGWICQEILKNKVPPISSSFCFIWPFAFVIEPTS